MWEWGGCDNQRHSARRRSQSAVGEVVYEIYNERITEEEKQKMGERKRV